jgi:arylsulfatase A-like enzyme
LSIQGHGSAGVLRDGKWTNFEGGLRVPCIMRWPGQIPAGTTNAEITGIIDLLPTFSAIAGVNVPSDRVLDGRNILSYMLGEQLDTPIHDSFIVPGATIRHQDWKLLIHGQKPGGNDFGGRVPARAGSLFYLKDDIGETTDVSAEHPEKVKELTEMMEAYMKAFRANTREIGWIEGYSKEKARAQKDAKKATKK